ncbi:MAG TPA: S41 family peptidase [Acidobacteriota bacterium]|nr:S41 family peptidase [Acidobacteriota bacterium]
MMVRIKLVIVLLSALIVAYGFVGGVIDTAAVSNDVYQDLSVFMDILHKIRDEYVEEPNMNRAIKGALQGMVESLDPYSSFVDGETYSELAERRGTDAASPGLVLSKRFGYAYVVSVLPGSPAEAQGLRTADVVESIEGRTTSAMSLWEAESRLMGESGSQVEVRVIRARRTQPASIVLERRKTRLREPSGRMEEEGIGVLRIPHFNSGVSQSLSQELKDLKSSGLAGLLIDVRGTALGDLGEAVSVASLFLPQGTLAARLKNRKGQEEELTTQAEPVFPSGPVLILTDRGTSGAAEVFTAALHDHQRAETLGERTNGQGGVQESFRLQDGSRLILATQRVFRPSGEAVQAEGPRDSGVAPDVRWPEQDFETNFYYDNVPEDASEELGDEYYRRLAEAVEKEQLRKAVEKIRERLLNKKAA